LPSGCTTKANALSDSTVTSVITRDHRRDAAPPRGIPGIPAHITSLNALGSGEGVGGFAIAANILGPDLQQIAEYSTRALAAAQKTPSLTDVKINLSL
jgi:multidrug efflux pump subunit AcrB